MKKLLLVFGLICLCTISCARISTIAKENAFEAQSRSYMRAIRWGEYEAAREFLRLEEGVSMPAVQEMQDIRVTSYEVKTISLSQNQETVFQTVEIKYYRATLPVVKTITDQQIWEYDVGSEIWYLKSGLPGFE